MGDGSRLASNIDGGLHGIDCERGEGAGEGDGQQLFPSCQAVYATHLKRKSLISIAIANLVKGGGEHSGERSRTKPTVESSDSQ